MKDLFRSSGNIVRADINIGADGRPKGSGTVIFETSKDAEQAISKSHPYIVTHESNQVQGMYNGFDWYGRILEVRQDRFAGLSGFRGGRGGLRGLRGGMGRGLGRGGFRGSFGGGGGSGRDFSNQDIYADYSGPDQPSNARGTSDSYNGGGAGGGAGSGFGNGGSSSFGGGAGGAAHFNADPSQQIMVRNVRCLSYRWRRSSLLISK